MFVGFWTRAEGPVDQVVQQANMSVLPKSLNGKACTMRDMQAKLARLRPLLHEKSGDPDLNEADMD